MTVVMTGNTVFLIESLVRHSEKAVIKLVTGANGATLSVNERVFDMIHRFTFVIRKGWRLIIICAANKGIGIKSPATIAYLQVVRPLFIIIVSRG